MRRIFQYPPRINSYLYFLGAHLFLLVICEKLLPTLVFPTLGAWFFRFSFPGPNPACVRICPVAEGSASAIIVRLEVANALEVRN